MPGSIRFGGFRAGGAAGCDCCGAESCHFHVCVLGCPDDAPLDGALVVVDGDSHAECITAPAEDDCCTISIVAAGSYRITITKEGYYPFSGVFNLACGDTITIELLPLECARTFVFRVFGCCGAVPGAVVTLSDGQTCTTDVNGECSIVVARGGDYTYTCVADRFADESGDAGFVGECSCQGEIDILVGMVPAPGLVCPPADGCYRPISPTMMLTDSYWGAIPFAWLPPPFGFWQGQQTVTYPPYCGCPGGDVTITYTMSSCHFGGGPAVMTITWEITPYVVLGIVIIGDCPQDNPPGNDTGFFELMDIVSCVPVVMAGEPLEACDCVVIAQRCSQAGFRIWPTNGPILITLTEM